MREIKFRAWDSVRKEWYGESDPMGLKFYGFSIFGECTQLCPPPCQEWKNLIIEQFTGLHDKNGIEIYEGDVITGMGYATIGSVAEIVFEERLAQYVGRLPGGAYYINGSERERIEVIGNIHQNPELLNA